jgi:hypothetical protein
VKTWLRFENCWPNIWSASARPWTSRSLGLLLTCVTLALVVLPSCGPGIRHVSLSHPTLRVQGETEQTRDGLTVSVEPITWENVSQYPEIVRTFTIRSGRATGTTSGAILPLPAFRVRVVNHTGHRIRFTESAFRLESGVPGSRGARLMSHAELAAWVRGGWREPIEMDPTLEGQLQTALQSLEYLTPETDLLDGDPFEGYLVFNVGVASDDDYRRVLSPPFNRYNLRLAEIPIETDDAGRVSRTTEFQFVFERSEYPQAAACRGSSEPSWETCEMETGR